MLKELFTLLFLLLYINPVNSQLEDNKFFFVGHAYGSHKVKDQNFDPDLLHFINNQKDKLFDRIVLGGDVVYDCNDNIEIDNLKRQLDSHNIKFIIGNHDTCSKMLELANKEFGSLNSYEIIKNTLVLYLNTSVTSDEEVEELYNFIKTNIENSSPQNVIIFTHQLIFSKSDFYVRVNSRKYYEYGNKLYDKVYESYINSEIQFHFVAGDIGAFRYTPYSFYDAIDNFRLYGVGIGNLINQKGLLIDFTDDIIVKFIDIKTLEIEPKEKYLRYKVQLYQFPKLILYYIKNYIIYILLPIIIFFTYKINKSLR